MADGEMIFDARLNTSGFSKDAGKLGGIVKGLGVFAAVKKGLSMVAGALDDAVSRYDTLNKFPKIMEQMGYGSEKAEKSINKLSDSIQGLPTTLDEIVGNTRQFTIALSDLDKGTSSAIAINNAFHASGAAAEEASRGTTQYLQMLSSGKVDMQSWRTLNETMTYALQKTAESFGFAGASAKQDLYAALRDGDITFVEFNDRIVQLNEGVNGFAEVAKTATGGIGTAMTNLKTRTVIGVTAIIDAFDRGLSQTRFKSIEKTINQASTGIKNALMGVAKAVEFTVKNFVPLTAGVITFGIAVKGVKLLSLIGQLGSVSAALAKMTPAFIAATAAKAKDLATTTWLTAVYAKDAIMKALNTTATAAETAANRQAIAAKGGNIAATIAQTVATTAATAAQHLLTAAMMVNPVWLMVAAVIALVAAMVALTVWMRNSASSYAEQRDAVNDLSKRHSSLSESITSSTEAYKDNVQEMDRSSHSAKAMIEILRSMVDSNGKVTASYKDIQQAIDNLNSAYDGLNLSYDEESGHLSASVDEVEKYIKAKNSVAKMSDLDKRRVELAQQQAAIETELTVIAKRRQEIDADETLSGQQKRDLYLKLAKTVNGYKRTQDSLAKDIEQNNAEIAASTDEMAQNTVNAYEAINGAQTSDGKNLKQLAKLYDTTTDQILADMKSQNISMQEWSDRNEEFYTKDGFSVRELAAKWGMTTGEVIKNMGDWGISLDEWSKEMDATHTSAGLSLEQLAAKWGTTTEAIRAQMVTQDIDLQQWSDNQDAKTQEVINSFNEIPAQYEKNANEMIRILKVNAERYSTWSTNIATLSKTMSAESITELQKLGPEANSAIEQMIADPAKAKEFEESIVSVMSAGADGAIIGASDPKFIEAGSQVGAGIGEGIEQSTEAETAATKMVENVATAIDTAVTNGDFSGLGKKIAEEISNGVSSADMSGISTGVNAAINAGVESANAAWGAMTYEVQNQFETMETSSVSITKRMMTGVTSSISSGTPSVKAAATSVSNSVISGLNSMVASSESVVSRAIAKVIDKLGAMSQNVKSAAISLGKSIADGMMIGLDENANAVYAKADAIASEVIRRLNKAFDIHSPSRVMVEMFGLVVDGMTGGLSKEENTLYKKVDELSTGVLERFRAIPEDMAAALNNRMRLAIESNQFSFSRVPAVAAAGVASANNVTNFYMEQTINSPRYTSPAENSREAEAMLRRAGWKIK